MEAEALKRQSTYVFKQVQQEFASFVSEGENTARGYGFDVLVDYDHWVKTDNSPYPEAVLVAYVEKAKRFFNCGMPRSLVLITGPPFRWVYLKKKLHPAGNHAQFEAEGRRRHRGHVRLRKAGWQIRFCDYKIQNGEIKQAWGDSLVSHTLFDINAENGEFQRFGSPCSIMLL
uniref:Uncharacterized protein n=1 Tax=Chromera velia CCMP2878 TaxID=1169474 RepID=A0A0G4HKP6_9ALVE|eukprot:Cvel_28503.t1-p1 / transcript=Cvel_28503.t1 / gene=Cvel_28503 / organism=Chromera_velia_CCMP2878 / gene_product=hypothetical protein / transcript_product=hypothetical protein / location=Cvel_scaffold3744:10591-11106(-) / protein_length=172 / sequence_SO=supercontig / SO=protein_coding / is_pseudo=false